MPTDPQYGSGSTDNRADGLNLTGRAEQQIFLAELSSSSLQSVHAAGATLRPISLTRGAGERNLVPSFSARAELTSDDKSMPREEHTTAVCSSNDESRHLSYLLTSLHFPREAEEGPRMAQIPAQDENAVGFRDGYHSPPLLPPRRRPAAATPSRQKIRRWSFHRCSRRRCRRRCRRLRLGTGHPMTPHPPPLPFAGSPLAAAWMQVAPLPVAPLRVPHHLSR